MLLALRGDALPLDMPRMCSSGFGPMPAFTLARLPLFELRMPRAALCDIEGSPSQRGDEGGAGRFSRPALQSIPATHRSKISLASLPDLMA